MQQYIQGINELYKYMYDYMEHLLKECFVIDISRNFIADEGHKWGLEPFHFQEEYYKRVLECLLLLLKKGEIE